ncbi:MAG: ATP-binding protein [Desulfobulbaceae bacterium]|nr:ATP-binding protein [Desulfobulbaceae bacterium]
MEQIEMNISASLFQVQFGTIAASCLAKAFYRVVTGEDAEYSSQFADAVELAVGEACTNSVKHCPPSLVATTKVQLIFKFGDKELIIHIKDCNSPFDFEKLPKPSYKELPEHGYGIHIMKESMNQVNYRHEEGCNIITMCKRIPEEK